MNEDIKEILENDIPVFVIDDDGYTIYITDKIKDYIINLQKQLEKKDAYIKYLEEYNPKYYKGKKFYGDGREDLQNVIDEIEKELWKIRQLTFTKYNSNEWNNCLSFNDDILPIINKLTKLKGGE